MSDFIIMEKNSIGRKFNYQFIILILCGQSLIITNNSTFKL